MEMVKTATSMLTATTLVFAGSSFLIGHLQKRASEELDDETEEEYLKAAYLPAAAGFFCMILTAAMLVSVIIPDSSSLDLIQFSDESAIGIASIAFPSAAAGLTCLALFREHTDPLQLSLLSSRFNR